jgi:hypothetical protein
MSQSGKDFVATPFVIGIITTSMKASKPPYRSTDHFNIPTDKGEFMTDPRKKIEVTDH